MIKLLLIPLSALFLSACSLLNQPAVSVPTAGPPEARPTDSSGSSSTTASAKPASENVVALKTNRGQVIIRLYGQEAPKTVTNFLKKSESGFYKNLVFHRVETGFVVQGGDPKGNGTGGGKITSEINSIPFKRGSVGLARGPIKSESNDSQFFICLATETCAPLTNEYVNFGEVISGMEFVDKIQIGDKILDITSRTK